SAKKFQRRSFSEEVSAKKFQRRSFSEEVSAKKFQRRSFSEEVSAKKLQTPPLPLPVRAGFKRGVPHGVPAAGKAIVIVAICFSCFYLFLLVFSQAE
ncbi:MAG: hypothetical protein K6B13_06475, partial [Prevotella sp.]|nr:hypothetical protein [Prevotella sp.]